MPVSPLMDRRQKGGITRSQIGFFSIVGIPLFRTLADVFEATGPLLAGVMANYKVGLLLALLLSMSDECCCLAAMGAALAIGCLSAMGAAKCLNVNLNVNLDCGIPC